MIPIYYNSPTFSGYYPQFPFLFDYNNLLPIVYSAPQNQEPTQDIRKNTELDRLQENNFESSQIKQRKNIKKKISKADNDYKVKDQNAQRNITSNIAHHMMSFIRKESITKEMVEKIIKIHNINITSEQFFVIFRKIKLRNYVRRITLQQLWDSRQNFKFSKIFRILCHHFLNNKCFYSILFSRKIKNGLKYHHLPKIRQLVFVLRKDKSLI